MGAEQLELEFSVIEKEIKAKVKKKTRRKDSRISQKEFDMLDFKRIINLDPPVKLIRNNKEYKSKSLPIQVVEQMLNAIYTAYQVKNLKEQHIEGQIITTLEVVVLHPVLNEWLSYAGVSCVPLISANQENHKYNHANIPAGKSYAIVNAVKNIGQIFRAEKDTYADVMKDYFVTKLEGSEVKKDDSARKELIKRISKMIKQSKSKEFLATLLGEVQIINDEELTKEFNNKNKKVK